HARQGRHQSGARPAAAPWLRDAPANRPRRACTHGAPDGAALALLQRAGGDDGATGADAASAPPGRRARALVCAARSIRRFLHREGRSVMYPLAHVLQRALALYPQRAAVVDGNLRFTYRQLAERVQRLAAGLLGLGLKRGDRVAILDWNSHRYLEMFYACAHAGLAFMPVNSRLALPELRYVLKDSDARALAFSEPFLPMYEELKGALQYGIGLAVPK